MWGGGVQPRCSGTRNPKIHRVAAGSRGKRLPLEVGVAQYDLYAEEYCVLLPTLCWGYGSYLKILGPKPCSICVLYMFYIVLHGRILP